MECRGAYSAQVNATKAEVSAVPVRIGGLVLKNTTAGDAYVQMFDLPSASVTVGTTAPRHVIPLLSSGGLTLSIPDGWFLGGSGLTIACTTTRTGSTNAAVDVFLITG